MLKMLMSLIGEDKFLEGTYVVLSPSYPFPNLTFFPRLSSSQRQIPQGSPLRLDDRGRPLGSVLVRVRHRRRRVDGELDRGGASPLLLSSGVVLTRRAVLQVGYPVVTVEEDGENLKLTQKRFLDAVPEVRPLSFPLPDSLY